MADALTEAKDRLRRYLGRGPIHGLGIRRAEQALCVYVHPEADVAGDAVLKELEREAAPFKVIVVKEAPPTAR
jgi:hypothetical protein